MTEPRTEVIFFKSSGKRRVAAFLIDHFIMTILMVSVVFMILGKDFVNENDPGKFIAAMLWVMIPGFVLYFAKDSLKGISIGRWIMGIMVRDENNQNKTPSFGRLFARNLLLIIWPVEFIVLVVNDKKKRLGDKIVKTVVVKNPDKPTKVPRILALIGVGIVFFVFVFFTAGNAMKNSDAYKIARGEIEKNGQIISETGGIKGYGMMPNGKISITNGQGQAQFEIKVLGNTKNVNVRVYLEKEPDGKWKLIEMQK